MFGAAVQGNGRRELREKSLHRCQAADSEEWLAYCTLETELSQGGGLERPKRIILVRHGESEGNVDETVGTRMYHAFRDRRANESLKCVVLTLGQIIGLSDVNRALDGGVEVRTFCSRHTKGCLITGSN